MYVMLKGTLFCALTFINMASQIVPYSPPQQPIINGRARPDPGISVSELCTATFKAQCVILLIYLRCLV